MSRLEEAVERLEARKAAAFGVRSTEELDHSTTGGQAELRAVLVGEDIDADELQDTGRMGTRRLLSIHPIRGLDDVALLIQTAWVEGVLLGVTIGKVPHE